MNKQLRFVITYLLLGLAALFMHTHENIEVPVNEPLTDISTNLDEWTMVGQYHFDAQVLEVLKPTDYLYRTYKDQAGNRVTLYLGYHSGGPDSGPIHSPKQCLPGGGWFKLFEEKRTIQVAGKELPFVQAVYQNDDHKEMFFYFFQVKGRVLTNEYSLKLAEITNSVFHKRRDSAFIRVSIPFQGELSEATEVGDRFLASIYPQIASVLPL
jgi:EpsI family protein